MSKTRWRFLEKALEVLRQGAAPTGLDAVLADRLEAAIASADSSRLEEASAELADFVRQVHAAMPPGLVDSLHAPTLDNAALAYEIGQIDFAQQLAARAASKVVGDDFMKALFDWKNEQYIQLLYLSEQSGVDLSEQLGRRPETVSRVMVALRQAGIVDCRREGTRLVNFLTPQAKAAYREKGDAGRAEVKARLREHVVARLQEQKEQLPEYLRSIVSLSNEDDQVGTV